MIKTPAHAQQVVDDDFEKDYNKLRNEIYRFYNRPLRSLVTEVRVYKDVKAFQQFINKFSAKIISIDSALDFLNAVVDTFLNSDYNYDILDSTQKKNNVTVTDLGGCPIYVLAKKLVIARGEKKHLKHYSNSFNTGQNIHDLVTIALKLAKTLRVVLTIVDLIQKNEKMLDEIKKTSPELATLLKELEREFNTNDETIRMALTLAKNMNKIMNIDYIDSEVWIAMRLVSGYWLVGRADIIDFKNNIVVDVKTFREQKTDMLDEESIRIFNQVINQLTLYMTALTLWSGKIQKGYVFYVIQSFDSKTYRTDTRFIKFDHKRAKLLLTIANVLPKLFTTDEKLLLRNMLLLYNALYSVTGEGEDKAWGDYCKFCPFNPLSRRYKTVKRNGNWEGLFTCPIPLIREGRLPPVTSNKNMTAFKESKKVLKVLNINTTLKK